MVLQTVRRRALNRMAQNVSEVWRLNCQLESNLSGRVTSDRVAELQNGAEMLSENN